MPPYNGITVSGAYIQLVTTVGNADNVNLEVNPSVYATIGDVLELRKMISELWDRVEMDGVPWEEELQRHNTAPQSHPDLRGAQRDMDARLALLELLFNTDVSGNPFTATFETLTGLTAQGVWNAALNRLEF